MLIAAASSHTRVSVVADRRRLTTRSRITNGRALLEGVDGRSAIARRFRDLYQGIVADVAGQGGPPSTSEALRQLCRRAALLSLECEKIEARAVSGAEIDVAAYGSLTGQLGRLFARIGLKDRAPCDTSPTLADLLREDREAQARGEDSDEA
jgi:hypothetical protein